MAAEIQPGIIGDSEYGRTRDRAFGGAKTLLLRYVIVGVLSLVGSTLLIRSLGPAPWASYTVAYFLIMFIDQSMSTRLLGQLIRSPDRPGRGDIEAGAALASTAGAVLLLTSLALAHPAADLYGRGELAQCLFAVGVCGFVYSLRATASALAERNLDYRSISIAEVVDQVSFYAVALILVGAGYGLTGVAWGLAVRGIVPALYLRARYPVPVLGRWDSRGIRRLLAFGGPSLAAVSVLLLDGLVPLLVLGGEHAVELAFFMTCATIAGYGVTVAVISQRISFPSLAALQRDSERFRRAVARVLELTNVAVLTIVGPIVATGAIWLPPLLGTEWERAAPVLVLSGVALAVASFVHAIAFSLASLGHAGDTFRVSAWMTGCYLLIAIPLVQVTPLLACPIAYLVSRGVGLPVSVRAMRRRQQLISWRPALGLLLLGTGSLVAVAALVEAELNLLALVTGLVAAGIWVRVTYRDLTLLLGTMRIRLRSSLSEAETSARVT